MTARRITTPFGFTSTTAEVIAGAASPARAVLRNMHSTRPTPNGCGNFR
jgi:hypothetical protein